MRTLAFLFLAVGFVAAIVLPNDIGTPELPAVNGKIVTSANHIPAESPDSRGFAACPFVNEFQVIALIGHRRSRVLWIGPSSSRCRPKLPLLI